jgi:hypothetical protein
MLGYGTAENSFMHLKLAYCSKQITFVLMPVNILDLNKRDHVLLDEKRSVLW